MVAVQYQERMGIRVKEFFGLALVFSIALVLRSVQYFGRSSMWLDELASAFNISERSYYQLATETLDFNQVAPLGFLWLQKSATLIFGVNDHAFRFFPFLLSVLSLVLFIAVARHFLKGLLLVTAFALFGLSIAMVFYGGEGKQYSGDVTAALFLVWSALELFKGGTDWAKLLLIAVGGALLVFCSMPAVVLAPIVLLPVFVQSLRKKIKLPLSQFLTVAVSWGMACILLAYYAKVIIDPQVQQAMTSYWSRGFAPMDPLAFLKWVPLRTEKEFSFFLLWFWSDMFWLRPVSVILLVLSVLGTVYLFRNDQSTAYILLSPYLVALLLAIFRILPFDGRVSLYSTWPLVIVVMAGMSRVKNWLPKMAVDIAALVLALPIGLSLIMNPELRPPYNSQSAQPVLKELKKQLKPGDLIYVYFKSRYALRFYGPKEGITKYVAGTNHASVEPILREIDSLRGNRRVWFFFSQWTPRQPFPDSIKAYMGKVIGRELSVIPDPDGNTEDAEVAAHLYDLSAPSSY